MALDLDPPRRIALNHGQARWVLSHFRIRTGGGQPAFDAYLKYLRRAGVPFGPGERGVGRGATVVYRYEHLMELVLALFLRQQAILPPDIARILAGGRRALRPMCYRAYHERESGLGAPVTLRDPAGQPITAYGVYLDFWLQYEDTGFLSAIPPRLLGPLGALRTYMAWHQIMYPRPPIPLSQLAEDVVRLAPHAPTIRRGRP